MSSEQKHPVIDKFVKSKLVDGRYVCEWSPQPHSLWDVFRYFFEKERLQIFDDLDIVKTLPQLVVDTNRIDSAADSKRSTLTWIGHATSYYQTDGVYFLTDPVWSERASPTEHFGEYIT